MEFTLTLNIQVAKKFLINSFFLKKKKKEGGGVIHMYVWNYIAKINYSITSLKIHIYNGCAHLLQCARSDTPSSEYKRPNFLMRLQQFKCYITVSYILYRIFYIYILKFVFYHKWVSHYLIWLVCDVHVYDILYNRVLWYNLCPLSK